MLKWLSQNFELFFLINSIWVISLLVARILLRAAEFKSKELINRLLHYLVVFGIITMALATAYVTWNGLQARARAPRPGPLAQSLLPDTSWVKSRFKIYCLSGNRFLSLNIDGTELKEVLLTPDPIREYYFSPDGRYILVITIRELYCLDRIKNTVRLIDSAAHANPDLRGTLGQVRWAPDSSKFYYEIARKSPAVQDNIYIFNLSADQKLEVQGIAAWPDEAFWDRGAENIYCSRIKNLKGEAFPEISLFKIPIRTLIPEPVEDIKSAAETSLPFMDLDMRGIHLYLEGEKRVFIKRGKKFMTPSALQHMNFTITEDGYLSTFNPRTEKLPFGKPREFFQVVNNPRAQPAPIKDLKWLPGHRYLAMTHEEVGIVILDSATGQAGRLIKADAAGWYVQ